MAHKKSTMNAMDNISTIQAPDFLSNEVLLKPKLESIFAEVENSLPNIDFELSDVRRFKYMYMYFVMSLTHSFLSEADIFSFV